MQIRFFAGAAEAAGGDSRDIDAKGLTLEVLREQLGEGDERLARVLEVSTFLADGQPIASGSLDGVATLDVLPPFAGG